MAHSKRITFWQEKPGTRRKQYKRIVRNELVGWCDATGLSGLYPGPRKRRRHTRH